MTSIIAIRLRSLVWLWLALLAMTLTASVCLASIGKNGGTIAYDGLRLVSTGYDGLSLLAFDYDSAAMPTVFSETNPAAIASGFFGKFGGFLAAEGTPLILQNAANGQAFESSVINALGATKNTASISVDGLGTSIPDLIDASGNTTEIKNVVNLSFTRQLQIQAQGTEGSFNLIVSPRTQYISGPLQDAVQGSGETIHSR